VSGASSPLDSINYRHFRSPRRTRSLIALSTIGLTEIIKRSVGWYTVPALFVVAYPVFIIAL